MTIELYVGDHHKKPGSPGDILEHHGIKGQKWGVRKPDESVGGRYVPKSSSETGRIIADPQRLVEYNKISKTIVSRSNLDSQLLQAKYGPPQSQAQIAKKQHDDHERLKKIAIGVGIGVGAAVVGVAVYKLNQAGELPGGFPDEIPTDANKLKALLKTNNSAYKHGVDGLNLNWDHGVDLPKGFILRRLSTVAETTPRPDGFFAAHLDDDVESYKAILPTFWNQWGVGSPETGGFLNHYQAKRAIRAPSGKESFAMFKDLIDKDDSFNKHFVSFWDENGMRGKSDQQLKESFAYYSQLWADPTNDSTKHWFTEVNKRGYNALIDFNDAGKLGKTPLRVIDGNMFDIVKNEPQGLDDFYTAAKKWSPELVHIYDQMTFALSHKMELGTHFTSYILEKYGSRQVTKTCTQQLGLKKEVST